MKTLFNGILFGAGIYVGYKTCSLAERTAAAAVQRAKDKLEARKAKKAEVQVPKAEVPKAEVPKAEVQVPEAEVVEPKAEEPQAEVPKAEEPIDPAALQRELLRMIGEAGAQLAKGESPSISTKDLEDLERKFGKHNKHQKK